MISQDAVALMVNDNLVRKIWQNCCGGKHDVMHGPYHITVIEINQCVQTTLLFPTLEQVAFIYFFSKATRK